MRDESGTLDQLWRQLEELVRAQQERFPHVVEVYGKIQQLAAERREIEEEMMRLQAQPTPQGGEKKQFHLGNGSAAKLGALEREISQLQAEWVAFKEQNAQIKSTAGKILKRVPPGAPEADQLARLAIVRGGGLTFEEIGDDLGVLLELAARRNQSGESVDTAKYSESVADPRRAEGHSLQKVTGTMVGNAQGAGEGHAVSDSFVPAQNVPFQQQAPELVRRRGRPRKFTWAQKQEWVRKHDQQTVSLKTLAKEMYPGEPFTTELRHRVESLLSRARKELARKGRDDRPDGMGSASRRTAPQP